jgi:large subunit ribosomal protein L15
MQMFRRIPKRGFNNQFALKVLAINVSQLEENFENGAEVNPETLSATALGRSRYDVLKILGDGELKKKLKISAHRFSKSAREKIEAAGGEITELAGPAPVVRNPMRKKKPRATKKRES